MDLHAFADHQKNVGWTNWAGCLPLTLRKPMEICGANALQCRRDSLKQKFNKTYELKHGAFFINGPAAHSEQQTRHPYRGLLSGSYTEATATGVGAPDRLLFNAPSGGKGISTPPSTEGWPPAKAFDRRGSPDVGLRCVFEDGIHKFPGFVTIQLCGIL